MIAPVQTDWNDARIETADQQFQAMLPRIRQHAWIALRQLRSEARNDAVAEVVGHAFCAWRRLVEQGRPELARPTPLTRYALCRVRAGRRIGCRQNINDILCPVARRFHGITIERIDQPHQKSGTLDKMLVETRNAGPAETASARIDFHDWLNRLSGRNRRIAEALALGGSTGEVAREFEMSCGRVSQLRRWFRRNWERFQGEDHATGSAAKSAAR